MSMMDVGSRSVGVLHLDVRGDVGVKASSHADLGTSGACQSLTLSLTGPPGGAGGVAGGLPGAVEDI